MLASLLLATSGAQAQQPVVLIHGIASNGSTWASAAQRLQQGYNVSTTTPNLPSFDTFENQATSLITQIGGVGSTPVAVGHSNGGVVARWANTNNQPWAGIVTVGTAHTGAPLAASVLNGNVFEEGRFIAFAVAQPFQFYSQFYPDDWAWSVAAYFGNFAASIGDVLPYLAYAAGYAAQNTVIPEMQPGSAFYTQALNTSANLSREASAVPQRISMVVSVQDSWGNMWHGLVPGNYQTLTRAQYAAGSAFLYAGEYYSTYNDWYDPYFYAKRAYAFLWYNAAASMFFLDHNWCALIGAADQTHFCLPNDGILPTSVQAFPNSTYSIPIFGPSHMEETADGQVYTNLVQQLQQRFGVVPAGGGNPGGGGGVSGVSISGPTTVDGCTTGNWTASVTGGTPPYSYRWVADGESISSGPVNVLEYTNSGPLTLFIKVTVTDAYNTSATSSSFKVRVSLPGSC